MSIANPVPAQLRQSGPYVATAGQTVFSGTFRITRTADVRVIRTRATTEANLVENTDYRVTGVGSAGFTVTLLAPSLLNDSLLLQGRAVIDRLTSVVQAGRMNSGQLDAEFDRNRQIDQEFRRDIDVHETRLDGFDAELGSIETRLDGHDAQLANHEVRITEAESDIADFTSTYAPFAFEGEVLLSENQNYVVPVLNGGLGNIRQQVDGEVFFPIPSKQRLLIGGAGEPLIYMVPSSAYLPKLIYNYGGGTVAGGTARTMDITCINFNRQYGFSSKSETEFIVDPGPEGSFENLTAAGDRVVIPKGGSITLHRISSGLFCIDAFEAPFAGGRLVQTANPLVKSQLLGISPVDASAGAVILTLPSPTNIDKGADHMVYKSDASGNTVTVRRFGSGANLAVLTTQNAGVYMHHNGTDWIKIGLA
jgi:archaellum component FlaC